MHDAYLSIVESLGHAGFDADAEVKIRWVNAEEVTDENVADKLHGVHGILVPGGFGDRGIEGKITAIRYAREQKDSFLRYLPRYAGSRDRICAQCGRACRMQTAPRLIRRHHYPVIDLLPEQKDIEDLGGTMRLGLYPCKLIPRLACGT